MRQVEHDTAVFLPPADGSTQSSATLFVHFLNGKVREVPHVAEHRVSNTHVVIELDDGTTVVFPRRDVYFVSFDHISPPAMQ